MTTLEADRAVFVINGKEIVLEGPVILSRDHRPEVLFIDEMSPNRDAGIAAAMHAMNRRVYEAFAIPPALLENRNITATMVLERTNLAQEKKFMRWFSDAQRARAAKNKRRRHARFRRKRRLRRRGRL